MARTGVFDKLTRQHKKPIEQVLVENLNTFETMERTAVELGMSYKTLFEKCKELGIRKRHEYYIDREAV